MKIGIDATFIKPQKTGGIEQYFFNLIKGFLEDKDNIYYLYLAKDNAQYFKERIASLNVLYREMDVCAEKPLDHLMFVLFKFTHICAEDKIDLMFYPSYMMPFFRTSKFKTVAVLHDIQPIHYPEYFPRMEIVWFNIAYRKLMFTADKIVTITNWCKEDIEKTFKHKDNIVAIYNPIILEDNASDFESVAEKYGLEQNNYYYSVLSMNPHKNLITLIKMMKKIKEEGIDDIPTKLIISGTNGHATEELLGIIDEYGLKDYVITTGFVVNSERDSLMKNANVFLFPSIFEGFGMPPIEAMHYGTKVITTKCTALPEVTQNKCHYVDDPFDESEWINKIREVQKIDCNPVDFDKYNYKLISEKYLNLFGETVSP